MKIITQTLLQFCSGKMKLSGSLLVATIAALLYLLSQQPSDVAKNEKERVIIVVGGGLAGLSASIEAYRAGANVFLLDKELKLGGNSAKASSGINAVGTSAQREAHSKDNVNAFVKDILSSGHGLSEEDLVNVVANESASAVQFLSSLGVRLDVLSQCGGHSYPRTHRASPAEGERPMNIGYRITSTLQNHVNSLSPDRMHVWSGVKVESLLLENGIVHGVRYRNTSETGASIFDLRGDAVVLTMGGYGASKELLKKYAPSVAHLSTTNGNFATGDAISLGLSAGAALQLMDKVQVHPTCFVDQNDPNADIGFRFLAPEALRGSGGILLNHEGKRFVNELGLRDHVTNSIFEHCERYPVGSKDIANPQIAYLLLSEEAVEEYQAPNLAFYKFKKLVKEYENIDDFATATGLNVDAVRESVKEYKSLAESLTEDQFGKKTYPAKFSDDRPITALMITPCIHYTMGGLRVNTQSEVLTKAGSRISGLYAAGETTGGLHGANRLAGNSLLECTVFGRIAGREAATNY